MRVYAEKTISYEKSGTKQVALAGSFYELPDDVASAAIADGRGKPANPKNEIIEPPPAPVEPEELAADTDGQE